MSDSTPTELPTVAELRAAYRGGDDSVAAQLFRQMGLGRPWVVWSPGPEDLVDPRHRRFLDHCRKVAGDDPLPRWRGFLENCPGHIGNWLIQLSRDPGTGDLSFHHFGEKVAEQFGRTLSGPMAGTMAPYVERFYCAIFDLAAEQRSAVLTRHEPPRTVFVDSWLRLVVPLRGDDVEIAGFAVMNVANNPLRVGLDIVHDPIFVLDAEKRIKYANPTARLLMENSLTERFGGEFFEETGIVLPTLEPPEDMVGRQMVEVRRRLAVRHAMLVEFIVSVSAVVYRSRPNYVVIVRPPDNWARG